MTGFESFKLGLRLLGIWWLAQAAWEYPQTDTNVIEFSSFHLVGFWAPLVLGVLTLFATDRLARFFWRATDRVPDAATVYAWNACAFVLMAAILLAVYLPGIIEQYTNELGPMYVPVSESMHKDTGSWEHRAEYLWDEAFDAARMRIVLVLFVIGIVLLWPMKWRRQYRETGNTGL